MRLTLTAGLQIRSFGAFPFGNLFMVSFTILGVGEWERRHDSIQGTATVSIQWCKWVRCELNTDKYSKVSTFPFAVLLVCSL